MKEFPNFYEFVGTNIKFSDSQVGILTMNLSMVETEHRLQSLIQSNSAQSNEIFPLI